MQDRNLKILIFFILIFCASCASIEGSRELIPYPWEVPENPRGCWIELETKVDKISGEFIELSEENVYVEVIKFGKKLYAVPRDEVKTAQIVVFYPDRKGYLGLWTLLGVLLSLTTHGGYLLISIPIWSLFGISSIIGRSYEPVFNYSKKELDKMSIYARYPQGVPMKIRQKATRFTR
jgi:hypothetical protein